VPAERLEDGIDVADLLVLGALAASKGVARQLIRQGGVTLGEQRVDPSNVRVQREQFGPDGLLVRAGKKRFHRFVVAS
jgi:tyrosyl-tRNA synthetase